MVENATILGSITSFGHGANLKEFFTSIKVTKGDDIVKAAFIALSNELNK